MLVAARYAKIARDANVKSAGQGRQPVHIFPVGRVMVSALQSQHQGDSMGNGWLSIVVLFCICLLAACATDFYVGHVGPPPGSLFDDNQLNIQLTSVNQLYNYNKTCQLGVIFTNKSEIELKPKFKMLLFDLGGDTVGQEPLDFPVVIPGRNFNGVKDVLLIGCARIASIRLTRLQ